MQDQADADRQKMEEEQQMWESHYTHVKYHEETLDMMGVKHLKLKERNYGHD